MKRIYEMPEVDFFMLDVSNIITTSGGNNDIDEDMGENDGEWM